MKKLLFLLLSCVQLAAHSQSLQDLVFKQDLQKVSQDIAAQKASMEAYKARLDSVVKALPKSDGGGGPQTPPNDLPKCPEGPEPKEIYNATTTNAVVLWHGKDVKGWDYSIYKGTSRVAFGSVKPTSNREPITFAGLEPGEYTFAIQGNTCKSEAKSLNFTVPKPISDNGGNTGGNSDPPVQDKVAKFQLILGTTGSGFIANAEHGIDPQWVSRIEAFKYSWGYGITGICLWIPWDAYEPKPGVYETQALLRAIKFCRDRGLTFSVAFMARRHQGDGFIRENEIVTGSNGDQYVEGVPGFGAIYAGYANERVHALMTGAIQSIAKAMTTYEKSFYVALAGGGAGEQVNYVFGRNGVRQVADVSEDNLKRFDEWRAKRGIAGPGRPPIIQGPGIDWPHPDYNSPLGLEFGRFTTYGIYKAYKSLVDAVKSVSDLPCLYFYSVTSNLQFRAIQNPNLNFIAAPGDGMYGSDGTGVHDLGAKVKVNSVNLGTFPNGISATEVDPEDLTPYQGGGTPPYCYGNLNYQAFLDLSRTLFSRGLQVMHLAMAFCEQESRDFEPVLKTLHSEYVNKPYVRPVVNASNTVTVEVTDKYRWSQDLMEGIDPYTKFTKYTDENFWGPIRPEGSGAGSNNGGGQNPQFDASKFTGYLDSNLGGYEGNVLLDVKTPSGTVYSYTKGQYNRDSRLPAMSHSKLALGATLLTFYDEGRLGPEDKVSRFIPSWNRSDKRDITIRQVIAHTSGIHDETTYDGAPTLSAAVDGMANTPLDFAPGTQFRYSTTSYQVLARIAEVLADKHWEQIFNERIRDKCSMGGAIFNPRGDLQPITGNPLNPNAGYGLWCTQNEWSNFAAMLRDGGKFNGQTVLSSKAIALLNTNLTGGLGNWGFGVILDGGTLVSESATGWFTAIAQGKWSAVLVTRARYETTVGANHGLRDMLRASL